MAEQLVECISNFSEGRKPKTVDAIVKAISDVEGVILLDCSSDEDHNRSVVTFVGDPKSVEEGAFQGIAKAAELIDMEKHSGEHPRMGAADVVPFVPISGVNLQDCIAIAQQLGERVGRELNIPVYLYEEAATSSARRNLANVRRGEYEGIKAEIGVEDARRPDFGPTKLSSAGAVAIGARQPLIAYNVYLNTDDVSIAKKIAKAVRHSSGGMRFVKGAGFLVDGKAQVSMNLTDFRRTPVARVVETIRRESQQYGVTIEKSELIGLIPRDALEEAAAWYLQLEDFDPQQVLERRIQGAQSEGEKQEIGSFLSALASADPTPGGGSAAAHTGAIAASLVAMVARLTVGRKKYKQAEAQMETIIREADALRLDFSTAAVQDAKAFQAVMAALKLPKETEKEKKTRTSAIEKASLGATLIPLDVARMALRCLEMAHKVAEFGNINAISDAGTAAALAWASLQSAGMNVGINLASMKKDKEAERMRKELREFSHSAKKLNNHVRQLVESRGGFSLD